MKDICKTLFGKGDVTDKHEMESGTKLRWPEVEFEIPFTLNSTNLLETRPLIGQIIGAQCRGGGASALSSVNSEARPDSTEEDDEATGVMRNVYSLVDYDYRVRAQNCTPRPDRNPLTHAPRKQRPHWPIEASVFYSYITKEED